MASKLPSEEQKLMLVKFMEANPDLRNGVFSPEFTREMAQNLWKKITIQLNSVNTGAEKDWYKWRKTWQDLKKNTIYKRNLINECLISTGGQYPNQPRLKDFEEKILELLPDTLTEWDTTFNFMDSPSSSQNRQTVTLRNGNTPNHDHSYYYDSIKKRLKKTNKTIELTKMNGLRTSQDQLATLVALTRQQMKSSNRYRECKLKLLRDIYKELKEIKLALKNKNKVLLPKL